MTPSEQLMYSLVDEFSECRPLLAEHLADQEGELLPYVLMGDVVRWAESEVAHNRSRVATLMQWLEIRFSSADDVVQELIAVGFVEMLPASPTGDPLLDLLGPSLRQVADEMNLFEPWDEPTD